MSQQVLERNDVIDRVKHLSMSPWEAERWAEENGLEPFSKRPDPTNFDPMREPQWTLPMAAAWFLWRSPDAVRDYWDDFRKSWSVWRRIRKTSGATEDFTCELMAMPNANLREIFASRDILRFPHIWPWDTESPLNRLPVPERSFDSSPRQRFSAALASESLNATGLLTMGKEQKRTSVPAEFLRLYFRYLSRGATLSEDYKRDLALVSRKTLPLRYEHILVERDAVIAADEAASRQEFDAQEWLIEHALGWIAYRNPNRFRLLARGAPSRPPGARATYPLDFVNHNPTLTLETALSNGQLIARPSTQILDISMLDPFPQAWWDGRRLSESPDLWFQRKAVLELWQPEKTTEPLPDNPSFVRQPTPEAVKTTKLQDQILRVAQALWPDDEYPPRVGERDRLIKAEFTRLGWAPPSDKTIQRALRDRW
jgi:hypothetical protein